MLHLLSAAMKANALKTFLLPMALGVCLWFLSWFAYHKYFVLGLPDSALLPIVAVPLAFPLYGSQDLWSTLDMFIVWILSCSLFFLPQLVAFTFARSRLEISCMVAITILEWLYCVWVLWSVTYCDYDYSFVVATVTDAALLIAGAASGRLVYHLKNRYQRHLIADGG